MHCKIFYSWQSDLENCTNRGFINKALEDAAKLIRNDDSIEVEPVIDRDTTGVPGSPDIANTIFNKIENAQVFVCDISIINLNTPFRHTPNPNVLLELGYAIKTLGWENVIMVMNTAFGTPELLPFDLKMRRVTTYNMPEVSEDRATERKKLQQTLEIALRSILEGLEVQTPGELIQQTSIVEQAINAIENFQPNQASLVRRFMIWLKDELITLKPDFSKSNIHYDELLIESIEKTTELIIDFAKLAKVIAEFKNEVAAQELYKKFGLIFELYNVPKNQGSFYEFEFDFYKFIGHELFVTFFSFLIQEEEWRLIGELLSDDIYVENLGINRNSDVVEFGYASYFYLRLLEENGRKLNRESVHPYILNERHTQKELGKIVPMQQFIYADLFLFLRSECDSQNRNIRYKWIPHSKIYIAEGVPSYLSKAYKAKYAQQLLVAFGAYNIGNFREILANAKENLRQGSGFWPLYPLSEYKDLEFGSK
jgi:hypothetical protein